MKKRDDLINLGRDMQMCGHDEPDGVPTGDVHGSCGTQSDISPRPAPSLLDPKWALLGVTGCHP
jgi:hypothetical protein